MLEKKSNSTNKIQHYNKNWDTKMFNKNQNKQNSQHFIPPIFQKCQKCLKQIKTFRHENIKTIYLGVNMRGTYFAGMSKKESNVWSRANEYNRNTWNKFEIQLIKIYNFRSMCSSVHVYFCIVVFSYFLSVCCVFRV